MSIYIDQKLCSIINLSPLECSDIRKNIEKKLKIKTTNKCTKDFGYIMDIKNILGISCVKMFSNGVTKCKVTYNFTCLKPNKQTIYPATVFLISKERQAIMCSVENMFNVLVEMKNLTNKNIKTDDKINVKLTDIEYNNFYHTIGVQV